MCFKDRLYRLIRTALPVTGFAALGPCITVHRSKVPARAFASWLAVAIGMFAGAQKTEGSPVLSVQGLTFNRENDGDGDGGADLIIEGYIQNHGSGSADNATSISFKIPDNTAFCYKFLMMGYDGDESVLTPREDSTPHCINFDYLLPAGARVHFMIVAPLVAIKYDFGQIDAESRSNGSFNTISNVWAPLAASQLNVLSLRGNPAPASGTHSYATGTRLTNSVNPVVTEGNMQYVCRGWTMTGNSPASGTSNSFSMTLTNDAVLNWLWETNAIFTGPTMELIPQSPVTLGVLGEYDDSHAGPEYMFVYELVNATPGEADADIMTWFSINGPSGTTLNFYNIYVDNGNLSYGGGNHSQTVTFTGAIPPAGLDPDTFSFKIIAYAPATAFISSNGWMEAESLDNGPFNTISNIWVPLAGPPTFILTATGTAHGSISPTNISVTAGSDALFIITASNHYRIAEIRTNDVSVGALPADLVTTNYTWFNVQSDGTLSSTFSPLIRQAHFTGLTVNGSTVTLAIDNLTIESSNAVERAFTLSTNGWNRIGGFITPSSCATNWTGSDTGTTPRFYRVRTQVP